jgi:hypothetical protein
VDAYFVVVNSLLILRKRGGYTIPGNELDGGDQHVWQLGNFNFTDNTALKFESESVG